MNMLNIWGNVIPGNSTESKLNDMEIKGTPNVVLQTLRFIMALSGKHYKDKNAVMDTFTYVSCIRRNHAKTTYEDIPALAAYPVDYGDSAVIVIPGGGYGYLSTDISPEEKQNEGAMIAKRLNESGIHAFVLRYRYNPYCMPVPLLDVQRAVRYVRAHAMEYGIDPQKIGLIGFSAGGYQVGGFLNLVRGKNLFPEDYIPDEIDRIGDEVNHGAMIYPLLTFRWNVNCMFCCFKATQMRDAQQRQKLIDKYELKNHLSLQQTPQFIAHGTSDILVNIAGTREYVAAANEAGVETKFLEVAGANHGFFLQPKFSYVWDAYLDWCKAQLA